MKARSIAVVVFLAVLVFGCTSLREPQISKHGDIRQYSLAVLPNTGILSSSSGDIHGNRDRVRGSSTRKEINPGQLIEGILLKQGIVSTDAVSVENKDKTLLVKYGESGKRDIAGGLGGYALEVTIALISAETNEVVYSCVAEGQGETEVDDIREAIHRCLSSL